MFLQSRNTLTANTSYYIVSQEFQGGDSWYDSNTTVQVRNVATINAAVSSPDGVTGWNVGTTADAHMECLDFKYDLVAPDIYAVVPNHRGYDYLADKLASRGYIIVSINANRGITGFVPGTTGDPGLIMARGPARAQTPTTPQTPLHHEAVLHVRAPCHKNAEGVPLGTQCL